jgi:hypothetical protein
MARMASFVFALVAAAAVVEARFLVGSTYLDAAGTDNDGAPARRQRQMTLDTAAGPYGIPQARKSDVPAVQSAPAAGGPPGGRSKLRPPGSRRPAAAAAARACVHLATE